MDNIEKIKGLVQNNNGILLVKEAQEKLITRKNEIDTTWYNGVYDKYKYPACSYLSNLIAYQIPYVCSLSSQIDRTKT